MPANQALEEVQKRAGPSGAGGGGYLAWRTRLEEAAAGTAPLLLIGGLALAGGGYGLSDRHIAGLAIWLLIAAMLVFGAASRATLARPFYWASGLIGALALLCAFSSLWSGSVELSVIEADRVLVYLGFFVATFLMAQTGKARERFGEGMAISLIFVAVLALSSRLLPDLLSVAEGPGTGSRLSYPLGYWNGDGVLFGIGTGLALWLGRRSFSGFLRWLAVVSLPAILLALYLTYSRGGLLALAITCGCLIVLSHDRLWLVVTLAIGAIGALPAVLAVQAHPSVAENLNDSHVAGQGLGVLAILLGGCLLAAALFAGLLRLERGQGRLTGRAVAASRDPRVLRRLALAAALVGIGVAIAVGGRAWDQFSSNDVRPPGSPQQHLTELSGSGRDDFWRVAVDAFDEEPLLGHGAGTYRISWHLLRSNSVANLDAHSLYLQAFAELGVVGGLLVLAMVGVLLWTCFGAWRAARGPRRDLYAVLLGTALAFAVCSAIDWFWQIAAMGAVFFLATGVLVAARCAQLAKAPPAAGNGQPAQRRYGLAIGGLVVAWIAAVALVGPLLVDREIDASNSAAAEGNFASAVSNADAARSIEPWATSPYKQLGLLAEAEGDYPAAIGWLDKAIDREDESWLLYYLRARVEQRAGDEAAASADQREAKRLNPEEKCLYQGFEGCG
jgi:O-Antigen ligase